MGVLDDLALARAEFERGDWAAALGSWSEVDPEQMDVVDLRGAAGAAYLLGRPDQAVELYQRAFRACQDRQDPSGGVHCAYHLAMIFGTTGDPALSAGWTTRAEHCLDQLGPESAEAGYVSFLQMYGALGAGDWDAALALADRTAAAGRRHGDSDLTALGLCAGGRIRIYSGRAAEGLARLDEAMAAVAAGRGVGGGLRQRLLHRDRGLPGGRGVRPRRRVDVGAPPVVRLAAGTGRLHRAELAAPRSGDAAAGRVDGGDGGVRPCGGALPSRRLARRHRPQRGRARRRPPPAGRPRAAEAAYQRAAEHGFDPQPGLALLWLAKGSRDAAVAAVRRLVAETQDPVGKCRVLPAAARVLLEVGAIDDARPVVAELDRIAAGVGSTGMLASAAQAAGALELAAGDAAGALPYLRKARQLWARVECPYEVARVRTLLGRALTALGDGESARAELTAALTAFRDLGARPDADEVALLLQPAALPGGLTAREVEVLRLVASGRSNAQIAAELVLSEKTVARHLSNIFGKLDVESRTAAAAYAYEHGLV